jgi:hypothetical protein
MAGVWIRGAVDRHGCRGVEAVLANPFQTRRVINTFVLLSALSPHVAMRKRRPKWDN